MQLQLFTFKLPFVRERRVLTPVSKGTQKQCPPCTGSCMQGRTCPAQAQPARASGAKPISPRT
jgi:hypothetical protein